MTKVFGSGSPEWLDAQAAAAAPPARRRATRHRPTTSASRSTVRPAAASAPSNPKARPDLLPDEPGGYNSFNGSVWSQVRGSGHHGWQCAPMKDLERQPDRATSSASPASLVSTDCLRARTLSYIAQMQEAGYPDHVRLHLGRARRSRRRRAKSTSPTARGGPYVPAVEGLRRRVRRSSSIASPRTGSRRTTHSSSSPSKRAITLSASSRHPRDATASPDRASTARR